MGIIRTPLDDDAGTIMKTQSRELSDEQFATRMLFPRRFFSRYLLDPHKFESTITTQYYAHYRSFALAAIFGGTLRHSNYFSDNASTKGASMPVQEEQNLIPQSLSANNLYSMPSSLIVWWNETIH